MPDNHPQHGISDNIALAILAGMNTVITMLAYLTRIINQQDKTVMAQISDIADAVAAEATVEASVVTLLGELSADLQAAMAANDPVAMQAVVDSINNNAAALSAAVIANTPANAAVTANTVSTAP